MRHLSFVLGVLFFVAACGDGNSSQNNLLVRDPVSPEDGSRCIQAGTCDGNACLTELSGWPGGYCTTVGCVRDDNCSEGSICHRLVDGTTACLAGCTTPEECRDGYSCLEVDDQTACLPSPTDGPPPGEYGSNCLADDDCNRDLVCETNVPGGYCLTRDCDACGSDSSCANLAGADACLQACSSTRDCRAGYLCRDGDTEKVCVQGEAIVPDIPYATAVEVLDIRCDATPVGMGDSGARYQIDFEVPEGAEGFMIVPIVERGQISPVRVEGPEGILIDLVADYRHHNLRATELSLYDNLPRGFHSTVSFDWPIQVPYAPQYQDLVTPGTYSIFMAVTDTAPCAYVLSANEGQTLDVNLNFVGTPFFDATTAPSNTDLQEAIARFRAIYANAGITIGEIRYIDAPPEIVERYEYIREFDDIKRLSAWGQSPGPTLSDHLSVDVFLVHDIVVPGFGGSLLGVSGGVPGPPGMHGNSGNGLVFQLSDLGADNDLVGFILAHEIGHYLGLRHTTEVVNGTGSETEVEFERLVGDTDPIMDTPECENLLVAQTSCADATNLMFPAAPSRGDLFFPELSPGQSQVMRMNPLVK